MFEPQLGGKVVVGSYELVTVYKIYVFIRN